MKTFCILLWVATVLPLMGSCARTVVKTPLEPALQVLDLKYKSMVAEPIKLVVLDKRDTLESSQAIVARVKADITQSLLRSGVIVADTASRTVEIRIRQLDSNFTAPMWEGCVRMSGRIQSGGAEVIIPSNHCVRKFNWLGYGTAENTINEAYAESLRELLSGIDTKASM